MKYSKNGDVITVEMTENDYACLITILATAATSASGDEEVFWQIVDFINRMNTGNPDFPLREIPKEFQPPLKPLRPEAT